MKKAMAIVIVTALLLGMVSFATPVSATKPGTYNLPGGSATTSPGAWQAAGKVYKRAYDLSGGGTIQINGIDLSSTVADGNPWPPTKNSFYVQFGVQEAARFWGLNPRYAVFFTLTIQGVSGVDFGWPWWYSGPNYMRSYLIQTWYTQKLPWERNDEGEPVAFVMGNGHGFNTDYSSGLNTLGIPYQGVPSTYDTFDLKFVFTPNPDGSMTVDAYSRVYATTPSPPAPLGWRAVKPAWAGVWPSNPAFIVPSGVIDWSGCKVFTLIANSGWSGNVAETYSWGSIDVTVP